MPVARRMSGESCQNAIRPIQTAGEEEEERRKERLMPGEGDGRAQARGKSHGCQVVRSDRRADEWPDEGRDGTMAQRILAHCPMAPCLPSHRQSAFFASAAYTLCVLAALHRLRQEQRPQELGDYVWLESCV